MTFAWLRGDVALGGGSPENPTGTFEGPTGNLKAADWLFRSKAAGILWLVARLWLGYEWLNAGYQKLWGSENAVFWNGGGAAVKGFATAGITGSAGGKTGASYGWWAGFLHNFVLPNSSWIAKVITLSELAVGVLLILGLFTGAAAIVGVGMNMIYMFSGSAGVNPAYALVAVFLILAWRNAGYFGADRFALPMVRNLFHHSTRGQRATPGVPAVVLPVH